MANAYITALKESLEKKISVLEEIRAKDEEQLSLIKQSPFPTDAFDKNAEEKGVLIYKLNKLDDGFELVYEKVSEELKNNRAAYSDDIRNMQELITKITDLSTAIQAEEARNKAALENYFAGERSKLKTQRSQLNASRAYSQAMMKGRNTYNGIVSERK